ncbi:MAG: LptF/LptG family permease [Gammaproteobacteria bacterium]|nr:LptF/LptG family permease [Gammaproteobacteria bacterium]
MLFFAVFLYLFYSNFLTAARSLLERGTVPPLVGLWWVHLLFFILAIYLLQRQNGGWRVLFGRTPRGVHG